MRIGHLIKYGLSLPPHVGTEKGLKYLTQFISGCVAQIGLRFQETYECLPADDTGGLASHVPEIDAADLTPYREILASLSQMYIEHRFDLLGSGWTQVEYGMVCPGFNGKRYPPFTRIGPNPLPNDLIALLSAGNRKRASSIRNQIDPDYRPIDWQIDFKSGYRWREDQIAHLLDCGHDTGADVKLPWELARLQHLPQLALAFILAKADEPEFESPQIYVNEFRHQVLDFLAANPPQVGVNWLCTMDVAIRAANLLISYDFFQRHGARFDESFTQEFTAAIWAHGRHIASHLEWDPDFRGNHFLANIAGLSFVAAYLPRTPETDVWLAFATHHLITEVEHQFANDGTNFEASTSYHRLSTEMVAYATALIMGMENERLEALRTYDHRLWKQRPPFPPAPLNMHLSTNKTDGVNHPCPFPDRYFERLERMAEFTMHVSKPNGMIVQIGDNDSGRFFKLTPTFQRLDSHQTRQRYTNLADRDDLPNPYWDEVILDHRPLVAAINSLFRRDDFNTFCGNGGTIDGLMITGLANGATVQTAGHDKQEPASIKSNSGETALSIAAEIAIPLPDSAILEGRSAFAYPDFGLYIWRTPQFFLSIRCGPVGQQGRGGHAHNDQLAIELQIDGTDWIIDPGSFIYTPSLADRNAYRSVQAHATPRLEEREPSRLDLGVFRLENNAKACCHRFDINSFHGSHVAYGQWLHRVISLETNNILIHDGFGTNVPDTQTPQEKISLNSPEDARQYFGLNQLFSSGYGKR